MAYFMKTLSLSAIVLAMNKDQISQGQDWQTVVENFSASLEKEPTKFYSVKNLCQFLLREQWSGKDQILGYLQDYCSVSDSRLSFHKKWLHLTNMENLAAYDKREIEKIHELMDLLEATSTQGGM